MIRKLLAAAAATATLFAGSGAMAAQIVNITEPYIDGDEGLAYPYGSIKAPDAGMQTFVKIFYSGGDLTSAAFTTMRDVTYTYWDAGIGMVNGNEYFYEQVCSVANGCIQIKSPGYAVAKLTTPRNWFAKDCNEQSGRYCSHYYWPNANALFDGVFTFNGTGDEVRISLQASDFTAVPEPATWAMMIMGFGLAGAALRRRQAAY